MRTIPPALQSKLDSGVTTLAHCHVLRRRDGTVMGFTDHDRDVVVDGVTCRAGTGLTASEATARLGLQVDGAELSGALADDSLTEDDLAAGRWDAAEVDIWLVDWSEPELNVRLASGTVGEVRREGRAFAAEMRSIADRLNQDSGRLYTATCAADLGDAAAGTITLQGDTTTPANVTISVASGTCVYVVGSGTKLAIRGFKLTTTGASGNLLSVNDGGFLDITGAMEFGASIGDSIIVTRHGRINSINVNHKISGGAPIFVDVATGAFVWYAGTTTLTGTQVFSSAFAYAQNLAFMQINGVTFIGSATGSRYASNTNSIIQTYGAGASYLPGNSAGSINSGGIYQ